MTQEELQNRIDKVNDKIEKIQRRITKWSNGLRQEDIDACKDFGNCVYGTPARGMGWHEFKGTEAYREAKRKYDNYVNSHQDIPTTNDWTKGPNIQELRSAYVDLGEARNTLAKYQNALNKLTQFDNAEKIPVIWEFLQNWKQAVIEFIKEDAKTLVHYYELESAWCDKANSGYYRAHPEQRYEDNAEMKELLKSVHSLTKKVFLRRSPELIDKELLNKELDKEVRAKYERLVNDVVAITGPITDASGLHISPKGELNGIVVGEDGKARVETIGAGGYNQDVILDSGRHGQIFHYRTLIHELH